MLTCARRSSSPPADPPIPRLPVAPASDEVATSVRFRLAETAVYGQGQALWEVG